MSEKKYTNKNTSLAKIFRKSNFLVDVMGDFSLIELKIMMYALANIKNSKIDKDTGVPVSTIKASDIISAMGTSRSNLYKPMKSAADSMMGKKIAYVDDKNQKFTFMNLVGTSNYEKGKIEIRWNPDIKMYLYEIEDKFTELPINIVMSFYSEYGLRLYELLKRRMFYYYQEGEEKEGVYKYVVNTNYLRLQLGCVDVNDPEVKKILKEHGGHQMETIDELPNTGYGKWGNFSTRILEPSVAEINEISDIEVTYELIKKGIGGKVEEIAFTITKKKTVIVEESENSTAQKTISEDERMAFMDQIREIIPYKLRIRDLKEISVACDYNISKVKNAMKHCQGLEGFDNSYIVTKIIEALSIPIEMTEDEIDLFLDNMEDVIDYPFTIAELNSIAEASGYDMDKIKKANDYFKNYKQEKTNPVGLFIASIKGDYKASTKKENMFTNHMKTSYDFEQLEKEIVEN